MADAPRRPTLRDAVRSLGPVAAVAGASTAIFLVLYRPFGYRGRVPWSYGLDNVAYASFVRTIQLEGGYGSAPSLGAPYGAELYDFPQGGARIHLLGWKVLGWFVDDPFTVLNLWFSLAFPVIAVVAYLVLVRVGVQRLVAGVLALVYAFLPYRFWHGLQHPTLSCYFTVPISVLLAVWVLQGSIPSLRRARAEGRWDPAVVRKLLAVGGLAVLAGSADPYYTVFTLLLLAAAGVFEAVRRHSLVPLLTGGLVAAAVGVVLVVNLLPEAAFRRENGANDRTSERLIAESEIYALHLAQMVAPSPEHRIGLLASAGQRAAEVPAPGEGGTAVGALGVLGLVVGAGSVLSLRGRARHPDTETDADADGPDEDAGVALVPRLGVLQLAMALMATVGGGSVLLAAGGFTQIRSWGRMVVFLAFLAFAALGLAAGPLLERLRRDRPRWPVAVGVVLVGVVGLLDVVPRQVRPSYEAARANVEADRAFVADMEARLPEGTMVFQLPVVPFPETPLVGMGSYDHFRPYILGDDRLRWSFGGLKGRVHDWQEVWATEPVDRQLDGIVAAGFAALYVDTLGFPADQLAEVEAVLGPPTGASATGRERWYDLADLAADLRDRVGADDLERLGAAVLTSVRTEFGPGLSANEVFPGDGVVRWLGESTELVFPNFGAEGREVVVRFTAIGPAGTTLRATGPGIDETIELTGRRQEVELQVALPEGRSALELRTDAPAAIGADQVDRRVRILALRQADAVVEDVLGPADG